MSAPSSMAAPEGFKEFQAAGGLFDLVGPIYARVLDGEAHLGFRVEGKHLNPVGICHGGMLATLVDVQLGFGAAVAMKRRGFYPTINLNCDFLAPARPGQWVQGRTELIKATPRMVFANAVLTADGEVVLRANGIMKIPSDKDPRFQRPEGATDPTKMT